MVSEKQVAVNMSARSGSYFGGQKVNKRVKKLKNGNGKDQVSAAVIKSRGELVIEWVWKLCKMVSQRSKIVPVYEGKGGKIECNNQRYQFKCENRKLQSSQRLRDSLMMSKIVLDEGGVMQIKISI